MIKAFNFTKTTKVGETSKFCYANSPLSTVGDAVIKLFLFYKIYKRIELASDTIYIKAVVENNSHLRYIAIKLGLDKLVYARKNQSSGTISNDYARLFEVVF